MASQQRGYLAPHPVPFVEDKDAGTIGRWVESEMTALARQMNSPPTLAFEVSYAAPTKPRAGTLAYADGTSWNPGSGEGLYRFSLASAWVFIG